MSKPLLSVTAADIDVSGLSFSRELPEGWLREELLDAEASATGPGKVMARLSRSGGADILVRGEVKADLLVPCARCLVPTPVNVEGELSLLLRPGVLAPPRKVVSEDVESRGKGAQVKDVKVAKEGTREGTKEPRGRRGRVEAPPPPPTRKEPEYEFTSEEADLDTYDGDTVVLDPFVREAILLELPNFPLCSEACAGIAPGREAPVEFSRPSVDPRLAPLGALRGRLSSQPSQDEVNSSGSTSADGTKHSAPADSAGRSSKSKSK
jgi:uncharacterized protein